MADVVATRVSVRALKTRLSAWLARAQAREVVEVTSHHRPIARITGLQAAHRQFLPSHCRRPSRPG
jgi:prevent-host-death family protein